MARGAIPTKCLEDRPQQNHTLYLNGVPISLTTLSKLKGFDLGYLSKIMNRKAVPSVPYLRRLAEALGMSVDGLLTAIDARTEENLDQTV